MLSFLTTIYILERARLFTVLCVILTICLELDCSCIYSFVVAFLLYILLVIWNIVVETQYVKPHVCQLAYFIFLYLPLLSSLDKVQYTSILCIVITLYSNKYLIIVYILTYFSVIYLFVCIF